MMLVCIGLDSSTREVVTNEPKDLLVEDSSQSQAYASPFDDSKSVEKMVGFFIGEAGFTCMREFLLTVDVHCAGICLQLCVKHGYNIFTCSR